MGSLGGERDSVLEKNVETTSGFPTSLRKCHIKDVGEPCTEGQETWAPVMVLPLTHNGLEHVLSPLLF